MWCESRRSSLFDVTKVKKKFHPTKIQETKKKPTTTVLVTISSVLPIGASCFTSGLSKDLLGDSTGRAKKESLWLCQREEEPSVIHSALENQIIAPFSGFCFSHLEKIDGQTRREQPDARTNLETLAKGKLATELKC